MIPFRIGKIRDYSYIIRSFSFRKFLSFFRLIRLKNPHNNLIPVNRIDLIRIHARLLINDHRRLDLHPGSAAADRLERTMFASLSLNGWTIFIRFGSSLYCFIVPKISIRRCGRWTIYILPPGFQDLRAFPHNILQRAEDLMSSEIAFTSVGFFNP